MLDNIVIAYSLTPVNKKINVTQTEDFTTRGFNYLLKPNGKLEKYTKGHSKYYYQNIPQLHRLPGKTLAILIAGGIVDVDRVEDTTTWQQWDTLEIIIAYNKLMNPELNIYGLDEVNDEYMLPISVPRYLETLCM
jgi:hypothetical protein